AIDGCSPFIAISGGRVSATAGSYAAAIGSGDWCDNSNPSVSISGGTVVANGGIASDASTYDGVDDIGFGDPDTSSTRLENTNVFGAASIHAIHRSTANGRVSPQPVNASGDALYCVTVADLAPNSQVRIELLDGFDDVSGIYSDEDGKIYLWLPDGFHVFYVNDLPLAASVRGADVTAAEWLTGVTADGIDVSYADGRSWWYDYTTRTLLVIGECVLSGTNTEGLVNLVAAPDLEEGGSAFGFTVSNLHLKASGTPLAVTNGAATVRLAGTNVFEAASASSCAAIEVRDGATLSVTNSGGVAALSAGAGGTLVSGGGVFCVVGGSFAFSGDFTCDSVVVGGGSAAFSGAFASRPVNPFGEETWCVTVSNLAADAEIAVDGLPDYYNSDGIFADGDGCIYLWLAEGEYDFEVGGTPMCAIVADGAATVFERVARGVFVDGVEVGSRLFGPGWIYDPGECAVRILDAGTYILSGTNTEGKVAFSVDAEDGAVELSLDGLCLSGYDGSGEASPIHVSPAANAPEVVIALSKTNTLAGAAGQAGIFVPAGRTLAIGGEGRLDVSSSGGAAIGGVDGALDAVRNSGGITITGGTIVAAATGGAAAVGPGAGGTGPAVVVSGGSLRIDAEAFATIAVDTNSNPLVCVTVDGLAPGAPVAFNGLPDDFGTVGIYADELGKVYLWLPENWETEHQIVPNALSSGRRRLLCASGTEHSFAANGYRYSVVIDATVGSAEAVRGQPLPLESLDIRSFAIEDGCLAVDLDASPDTWLYGFAGSLAVRAAVSLEDLASQASALDLGDARIVLKDGKSAEISVPLPTGDDGQPPPAMFFIIDGPR
ncbi:MAG: carbohydrate-binding domain-containing protein, partial [Kiritimatiellae bacterium]|nr:carbohydrate-binding domain-containing protein [Kiritimatiellia bacterium]